MNEVSITVDGTTGFLSSFKAGNDELIKAPLQPSFWRAITDNDRIGYRTTNRLAYWKTANKTDAPVKVSALNDPSGLKRITAERTFAGGQAKQFTTYTLYPDGSLSVEVDFHASKGLPEMPRLGLQLGIPASFTQVEYLGKGPQENYNDRSQSAFVGHYKMPLTELMTEYVYPQANGNRTGTHWTKFTNAAGRGLMVSGEDFQFSAYPYTTKNLEAAKMVCELEDAGYITLNLDHKQMGVGGFNSWSMKAAPDLEYRVPAGDYRYSFTLAAVR